MKTEFNWHAVLKWLVVGVSLSFSSVEIARASDNPRVPKSFQMAQKQVPNYCGYGTYQFAAVETANFWVNICGRDFPEVYVGVSKYGNTNQVRIPVFFDGNKFVAKSGSYSYIITARELVVTQNNRIVRRDRVVRWD